MYIWSISTCHELVSHTPLHSTKHHILKMDSTQKNTVDCSDDQRQRGQWIRAGILGANDGLLSTTSLMLGVGAAREDRWSMVLSGLAGALAGASSMAVGEYVSVSTQRDIEKANREKMSTAESVIMTPGRSPMMKVIAAEDVNIKADSLPNPLKAAGASAIAFLCGASVPLVPALVFVGFIERIVVMCILSSIALAVFGGFGAYLGGSRIIISAIRALAGGLISMGLTYALLKPFDKH